MFDMLIKNGTVVDGTGGQRYNADVAISEGKIKAIGRLDHVDASSTVDATGLVVAPGFIDIHSHSDTTMLSDPGGDSKAYQGVTTEVTGNCGSSPFPVASDPRLAEYQRSTWPFLEAEWGWTDLAGWAEYTNSSGISLNIAPQVGHGEIRKAVGLNDDRPPTSDEMRDMRRLAAEAMDQGAFSLSTGLTIVPSSFASTEELVELVDAISPYENAFYVTHARVWDHVMAIEEAVEIARRAKVPLQYSHVGIVDPRLFGKGSTMVALFDRARSEGQDVTFDMYPYIASSSSLLPLIPEWLEEGGKTELARRLRNPKLRRQVREEIEKNWFGGAPINWDGFVIADMSTEDNSGLVGLSVAEIGKVRGTEPMETAMDLLVEEGGEVPTTSFNRIESDMRFFLGHEASMIGSDGYAFSPTGPLANLESDQKATLISGKPHPRSYGTYPRILGRYVRDEPVISLETAVKKMTGLPAQRLGLKDRGRVEEGLIADLTLFNPRTVIDKATFDNPSRFPDGIPYVFVAGEAVVLAGKHTGATPGKVLRRGG